MKKPLPDFNHIEPHQEKMHDRLRNWSRWVSVAPGRHVSSMFKLYRSPQHWEPKEFREPFDPLDAQKIEKLVCALPKLWKDALKWYYITPLPVYQAVRLLGHSESGLYKVVRDARQALINLVD